CEIPLDLSIFHRDDPTAFASLESFGRVAVPSVLSFNPNAHFDPHLVGDSTVINSRVPQDA
ncbi:hypothetical protein, partial [Cryobacterium aureum]|uniref:hypothetical protein n=1 Tax=Cryobacterium aureum TaxID=995037 RepID=UPI00196AE7CC